MAVIITAFPICHIEDATGKFIIEGFEELGHKVAVNIDERGEHRHDPAQALMSAIKEHSPDLVFLTRTPIYDKILSDIKKTSRLASMNVDARNQPEHWRELYPLIKESEAHFIVEGGHEEGYRSIFGKKVYFMPTACSKRHRMHVCSKEELDKYGCDVAFIGAMDGFHSLQRRPVWTALNERFKCKWWGPASPLGYADTEDFIKVCSAAKVVLGNNWAPHIDSYVSERDWRVLGCGGVLLTNLYKNKFNIMQDEKHFLSYKTPTEAVIKAEKIINDENRALRMRQDAYTFAHEKNEFKHRMQYVCQIMGIL